MITHKSGGFGLFLPLLDAPWVHGKSIRKAVWSESPPANVGWGFPWGNGG